jgi:hypothetical protein
MRPYLNSLARLLSLRPAIVICLWVVSSSSYSDIACPPNPCNAYSSERPSCVELADWVLDGVVASVSHGNHPYSTHFGPEVVSGQIWDRGNVVLRNVTIVKGSYPVANNSALLQGGSHCWERDAYIPADFSGKAIRVYGTNREGIWIHPGIITFDLIADIEARMLAGREVKESRIEREMVNGWNCRKTDEEKPSNEIIYWRGKTFLNKNAYPQARICFLNVLKQKQGSMFSKEAYFYLGLMYELGLGVDRDMGLAKDWYSKAGL